MNVREIFLHHALGVTPKALKTVVSNTHIQTTGENFMKKSLLALALLGAFTASAFAEPSVTLYGRIDTGLAYTHQHWSADGAGEDSEYLYTLKYKESEDSLSMRCDHRLPLGSEGF